MTTSTVRIAVTMWAWAALLRPLKHLVPFDTLVRLVHPRRRAGRHEDVERAVERYLASSTPFPRRAPGNCLERSLAAYRLLCAAGANPMLVVGLRHGEGGGLHGHVWLTIDGRVLAERPGDVALYTPLVRFDSSARPDPSGTSRDVPAGIRFA